MSTIFGNKSVKENISTSKQKFLPASEIKYKSHTFIYTQIIDPKTSESRSILLRKHAPLNLPYTSLERKKLVKINIYDPVTKQPAQYYIRVRDICKACGLPDDKDLKEAIKNNRVEEFILEHNYKAIANKIKDVIKPTVDSISILEPLAHAVYSPSDMMTRVEALSQTTEKLDSEKLDSKQIGDLVNKILSPSVIVKIKQEYSLDLEKYRLLERLALYVPAQNLEKILHDNQFEAKALLKTFYKAAQKLEHGLPQKNLYVKKTKTRPNPRIDYDFTITPKGDFIISSQRFEKGNFKKVYRAVNVTKPDEKLVKIVIRGNKKEAEEEEELKRKIYESKNSYVIKPSKITILTKTTEKVDPSDPEKLISQDKYIYFEKMMEGDGEKINQNDIKGIGQFCHDVAKGLAFLHKLGYVHCDVKIWNALVSLGRAFLTDFGLTCKINEFFKNGTLLYLPREYIKIDPTTGVPSENNGQKVHPSLDSYSLGITILHMLYRNFFDVCESLILGDDEETNSEEGSHNDERPFLFGLLEKDERNTIFNFMRENAKYNVIVNSEGENEFEDTPEDDYKFKMGLIDLAERLTNIDPEKRPSCIHAFKQIAKIYGNKITTANPS